MNKKIYDKITSLMKQDVPPRTITELLILASRYGLQKDPVKEAVFLSQIIDQFYTDYHNWKLQA